MTNARTIAQVLSGHTSESTAYVVDDYPYGFTARCSIRYWIETAPKKGARFCSQTTNPKTGRWNAPKKSTYTLLGRVLYLDENGHVQSAVATEYSSAAEIARFVADFNGATGVDWAMIRAWALRKAAFLQASAKGAVVCTINGEAQPTTDAQLARYAAEAEGWVAVARQFSGEVRKGVCDAAE